MIQYDGILACAHKWTDGQLTLYHVDPRNWKLMKRLRTKMDVLGSNGKSQGMCNLLRWYYWGRNKVCGWKDNFKKFGFTCFRCREYWSDGTVGVCAGTRSFTTWMRRFVARRTTQVRSWNTRTGGWWWCTARRPAPLSTRRRNAKRLATNVRAAWCHWLLCDDGWSIVCLV